MHAPIRTIEGNLVATGKKFAIVASRWNSFVSERLIEGAIDTIVRHGGSADHITLIRVPGSFELPMAVQKAAQTGAFDAILAVGALIRGATPHFDYIAAEATKGVASVSMQTGVPVAYGIITTNTLEQAIERSGSKVGNKGSEAAQAAIEMANLYQQLSKEA
ncbi:MAG: 6,7-dimethyl-8-ribityllumazine synthase [Myxococcota bacterium]